MNKLKMSLENIQGKMSRMEMKNIMAGSGNDPCNNGSSCTAFACYKPGVTSGICRSQSSGCNCVAV